MKTVSVKMNDALYEKIVKKASKDKTLRKMQGKPSIGAYIKKKLEEG